MFFPIANVGIISCTVFAYIHNYLNYICIMKHMAFRYDDVCVEPDRQIGPHVDSGWELSHVICGGGVRTMGDASGPIVEGEIVLVPPDMPHVWRFDPAVTDADGNIANISVFFGRDLPARVAVLFPELAPVLGRFESMDEAVIFTGESRRRILDLLMAMREMQPWERVPYMIDLLIEIGRAQGCVAAGHNARLSRADRRMEKIRTYCACNYGRTVTLDEMAAHVGMNKSALCTFMRRHARTTFSAYLNAVRLEVACDRLRHTECSVAEIAMDCGFQNVTYFNRLFRARYGCTPKQARAGG